MTVATLACLARSSEEVSQLELAYVFTLAGIVILANTVLMARRLRDYMKVQRLLESSFDVSSIDVSGRTEYVRCLSHQWAMDNVVRDRPGWLGTRVYEYLRDNTFSASICILLIVGVSVLLSGILIVRSIAVLGGASIVLLFSVLALLGPEGPRSAEMYLRFMLRVNKSSLNAEDYAYTRLAISSIRGWLYKSTLIAILLLIMAPNAYSVMSTTAMLISLVIDILIVEPAVFLLNIHLMVALGYIVIMTILILYLGPREVRSILKKRGMPEEDTERSIMI